MIHNKAKMTWGLKKQGFFPKKEKVIKGRNLGNV